MNDNISEQGCQRIKYGKNAYLSFISSISSAGQSKKIKAEIVRQALLTIWVVRSLARAKKAAIIFTNNQNPK